MAAAIAPDKVAAIQALRADGYEVDEIAGLVGVHKETVRRYVRGGREAPHRPNERRNPLFDPARDGCPDLPLTARVCGDPLPGRRELVAGHILMSPSPNWPQPYDPLRQRQR